TGSTKPSHCLTDTCLSSEGEKCLNPIQTSFSPSGQKFLTRKSEVPLGNVSGQKGGTLAVVAGTASNQPSHCLPDTWSSSDGEKCVKHIHTSFRISGQKFLPPTSEVPIGNVSG
ncbi:hypothetical protein AVEN_5142-1, partial [Araneus ventricosus]